jgi:phosphatidylglycerol:prolipoprotein diacylglycerol transferase
MNARYFRQHISEIFMIHRGGLVFYGGVILAFACGLIFIKWKRYSVSDTADLLAPFIALAHAIGRIGCFLNGCCYGKPTSSFLGVKFPFTDVKIYPTQIFSFIGLLFIFLMLFRLQKKRRFGAQIFLLYLISYGVFRFLMDFLRGDLYPVFAGLTVTQIISVAIVIPALILYAIKKRAPG